MTVLACGREGNAGNVWLAVLLVSGRLAVCLAVGGVALLPPVAALLSGCAWFALLPVCCDSLLPLAAACLLGSVLLLPLVH